MPTKKVFAKLIKRATQIKDVISEINPKEEKTDKRKIPEDKKNEDEKLHMIVVNNNIVYGGVDQNFNDRRVLPPGEIGYPDLLINKDFYDRIGCPHLAVKYAQIDGKINTAA